MYQVEVWMQTFAPGSGTPIHRHDCEEVFIVLGGTGTFFLNGLLPLWSSSHSHKENSLDPPEEHAVSKNCTFTVPPNSVHQVKLLWHMV